MIDDYLQTVRRNLDLPMTRRDAIIDELRAHLDEAVQNEKAQDPGASDDDVQRRVLRDFGDPRQLAASYDEGTSTVATPRGRVALEVTGSIARSTGKVLKFGILTILGIAGVVLVVAAFLVVFLADDIRDFAETHAPEPVFDHERTCTSPCNGALDSQSFFIHNNAREVRFEFWISPDPDNEVAAQLASLHITVTDPSGDVRFDRTFTGTEGHQHSHITWSPEAGDWSIEYEYQNWEGSLDTEVWTVGLGR